MLEQVETPALILDYQRLLRNWRMPGRAAADEVTIFDSSGSTIQDLAICDRAVELAEASRRSRGLG